MKFEIDLIIWWELFFIKGVENGVRMWKYFSLLEYLNTNIYYWITLIFHYFFYLFYKNIFYTNFVFRLAHI